MIEENSSLGPGYLEKVLDSNRRRHSQRVKFLYPKYCERNDGRYLLTSMALKH